MGGAWGGGTEDERFAVEYDVSDSDTFNCFIVLPVQLDELGSITYIDDLRKT